MDIESGRLQPFTSHGDDYHPVWARSSDQIVFTRTTRPTQQAPGFTQDLHLQRLGSDSAMRIGESSPSDKLAANWHADGRTLLYSTQAGFFWHGQTGSQAPPVRWFQPRGYHSDGQFSPDGRWVAYVSNESGSPAVYVRRFPEADGKAQISTGSGVMPRWRPDGRALFYIEGTSLMEVELHGGSTTIEPGPPRRLFDLGDHDGYAVLRDGAGFVICRAADPFVRPTITVVLNWAAELLSKGTGDSPDGSS